MSKKLRSYYLDEVVLEKLRELSENMGVSMATIVTMGIIKTYNEENSVLEVSNDMARCKNANDNIEAFYRDIKGEGTTFKFIRSKAMYKFYLQWCSNNNTSPMTINQFGVRAKKYFTKKRSSSGNGYVNVEIQEGYDAILEELNNEM